MSSDKELLLRKLALVVAATAAMALPVLATAAPASADERTCYTPGVAGFDSIQVCHYLPIELEQ